MLLLVVYGPKGSLAEEYVKWMLSKAPSARRRESSFLDVQPPTRGHAHCDPGYVDTLRDPSTYGLHIKASSDSDTQTLGMCIFHKDRACVLLRYRVRPKH